MIEEKSCGAVLFHENGADRRYLILHSTQGHYTLCKGHVEAQETEHETAVREIREETGLSAAFIPGFRETIVYSPRPGHRKEVVFFLAKADDTPLICQPEEVASAEFLPYTEAAARLTHDSDRAVLEKAERRLSGR